MTKRKNILFIVSRLPINTRTGDRLRVYHFIKKLTERGHQVDVAGFVPIDKYSMDTDIKTICRYCIAVEKEDLEFRSPNRAKQLYLFFESFLRGYPFRVWQWRNKALIARVRKLINGHRYDVIHFSEVPMGIIFDELKEELGQTRIIFDLIDSVALSLKHTISNGVSLLWPFRIIEQSRLKQFEKYLASQVDKAILISERDKNFLALDDIAIIPNGIEDPGGREQIRDIDILFTGNMAAEANIDAVEWFVDDILPSLLREDPTLKFTVAGANPPASIKALQSDNVDVTGYVKDLNEYYRKAKLFVCPMRLGAGQKNKILEAMINQTPVISTTEGNIGVDAPVGAIELADSAEEFACKILELLRVNEKRKMLASKGYRYVKENFSWEESTTLLERCYG